MMSRSAAASELGVIAGASEDEIRAAYKVRNFLRTRFETALVSRIGHYRISWALLSPVSLLKHTFWLQKLAVQWHPDKNRGKPTEKEATGKFQKISAAYKILTEASIFHRVPGRMQGAASRGSPRLSSTSCPTATLARQLLAELRVRRARFP
jgi:hypothetical protein